MQRLEIDCSTGEQILADMTPEEEEAHLAAQDGLRAAWAEAEGAREEAARRRAEDLALVATHPALPEEVRGALTRLVG